MTLARYYFLLAIIIQLTFGGQPCMERWLRERKMVCVCNSTYCDTYDHLFKPPQDGCLHVSSNEAGLRFVSQEVAYNHNTEESSVSLTVDRSITYQSILGFGAAFTDSATINLHSLSEETQNNLLRSYYSDEGLEYNMGRVPIAGTDYSLRPYSYDDVPGDEMLEEFSLVEEDLKYKIPAIQEAVKLRESVEDGDTIKLFASPWSAPAWMKSNNRTDHGGYLEDAYKPAWAQYFLKFLEEYDKQGVNFWGLTIQNEPMAGHFPSYPWNSMAWMPWSEGSFVRDHLGPVLQNSTYSDTLLISMDDQRWFLPVWSTGLLSDNSKAKWYSGVGIHWYADMIAEPELLDEFHGKHPDLFLLNTEACADAEPVLGRWKLAERYAHDILEDLNHYVAGWLDWNFALDTEGGPNWSGFSNDSPILIDADKDEFYKQPSFYAMGHFSKFIPRDSLRIDIQSGSETNMEYGAFLTPSDNVVSILLNPTDEEQTVNLVDGAKAFSLTLSAYSINTVVWS